MNSEASGDNDGPPDNRDNNIERVVDEIELQGMPHPEKNNGSQQQHGSYDPIAFSHAA